MSQKRQQEEVKAQSKGDSPEDKRRRFRNVVQEVMRLQNVKRLLEPVLEPVLEPLIRRVVKEEVELAIRKHLTDMKWICEKEQHSSETKSIQLKFMDNLSLPMFTSARIEGDKSPFIRIGLVEPLTGQTLTSGPGSSAKVEIVVLEGDFDGDEGSNWTSEDFKNNIVREREGKKPLLNGDVFLILKDGIGIVREISFTDNSSWTRSRKFRLGARMVDQFDGIKVREATTESFAVRDHRGELYRKRYPPSLSDEVWRLEKIGKDGAFHKRLSQENINTVKDFLTLLFVNSSKLRHILGMGMSAKMWEVTVEHARTCVLDKTVHVYYYPRLQKKSGVVFNVVSQVMGLFKECQYVPVNKLSEPEKIQARKMVIAALDHWNEVTSFEDETFLIGGFTQLTNSTLYASNPPGIVSSSATKVLASQNICGFDYSVEDASGLDDFTLPNFENTSLTRYDQTTAHVPQVSNMEGITQSGLSDDYHMRFFDNNVAQSSQSNVGLEADLQTAVDVFILQQRQQQHKAQTRWTKLFSVLKWFSIRKIAKENRRLRKSYTGLV